MMRPMKLAGDQLMFGADSLTHLKSLQGKKAVIVTGGSSMDKGGFIELCQQYLGDAGIDSVVFRGVEPDPSFETVQKGAKFMLDENPDWIIAIGGGSAMDAAKAMWVLYEHPELTKLEDILPPRKIPTLRTKAKLCCIPSTSGTASEVSRSVVITDSVTHHKYGIGDMEMMPDVAICDPAVTEGMPPAITAQTGMDALTHAVEAYVSTRANYLSDILAKQAALDIIETLPKATKDGHDIQAREIMLNASMVAGLAFTNVSLGIVHSMAHSLGSEFGISHGLADAILLPYIIEFNSQDERAKKRYQNIADAVGKKDLLSTVRDLNQTLGIANTLQKEIPDENAFIQKLPTLVQMALADGCTKTNPIIPNAEEMEMLYRKAYYGA